MVSLLMFCNVLYYRFWKDIMGFESLMLWKNVNSVLLKSAVGLLVPGDILFVAVPLLLTVIYCMKYKAIEFPGYPRLMSRLRIICFLLVCFCGSQLGYAVSAYRYGRSVGLDEKFIDVFMRRYRIAIFKNQYEYNSVGGLCFGIKSLCHVLTHHRTIDIDDTSDIDSFIREIGRYNSADSIMPDSIVENNSGKNLIVIVVESLNSEVIGKTIGDKRVTPTLDSLLQAEGTISSLNMVTQVDKGGSSDGQLLINTGLLPLKSEAASMSFSGRIDLPSLVRKLRKDNNIAVFADDASGWKQREVYGNMGFDRVHCSSDFDEDIDLIGSDAAMFRFGEKLISEAKGSFFIEFITISMHVPFEEIGIPMQPWLIGVNPITERNYLNTVNYFDRELGGFLVWLNDNKLYDNSIIVIVSDHSQTVNENWGDDLYEEEMAFVAVNTGVTRAVTAKTGQVNVYPTIVRLMNANSSGCEYTGLGKTLLDPFLSGALDPDGKVHGDSVDHVQMNRAWQVSDSIIRGDYFRVIGMSR